MTAAFHTLGCKTNAYETQAVLQQFQDAGYEIRDFAESCDVYVINTCSVTQEAARKSRQISRRCKRQNPDALVVVTGCYAQETGAYLLEDGSADIIVGNSEKSRILSLVKGLLSGRNQQANGGSKSGILQVPDLTRHREYESQMITEQEDHVRAYVKIQDGCDRFCSYCLIPFLRGRSRSRNPAEILEEVKILASKGYQEVVLTGIDISTFRLDPQTGETDPDAQREDLAVLVEWIAAVSGIRRIRLGSLEAGIASDALIDRLSGIGTFCPQFHLSLQSGCDSVLKRMNRHYTTAEYAKTVSTIRDRFPGAAITTDVIAGFPGETEEEFEATCDFVRKIAFSRMHVFPYSRRAKTRADQMPGQLSRAIKEQRARELIRIGEDLRQLYESRFLHTRCSILVEEAAALSSGEHYLAGYTPEYVRILVHASRVEGSAALDTSGACPLVNQFLDVVPTRFENGVLIAD